VSDEGKSDGIISTSSSTVPGVEGSGLLGTALPFVLLNMVTVLWGTQHAVIKSTLLNAPDSPGLMNFCRFALASLLFIPWTPNPAKEEDRGLWRAGVELGLWMFLGKLLPPSFSLVRRPMPR
jgi:hypothetical protein